MTTLKKRPAIGSHCAQLRVWRATTESKNAQRLSTTNRVNAERSDDIESPHILGTCHIYGDCDGGGNGDNDEEGGDEDEDGDVRQQLMRQGGDNLTTVMIEAGIDDDYEAVRCSS